MSSRSHTASIVAVLVAAIALASCQGDGENGRASSEPSTEAGFRVCFRTEALQSLGGESLAAANQAQQGDPDLPPVGAVNLRPVVNGSFAPSLRGDLRRLSNADTAEADAIVLAAERGLRGVQRDPSVLLNEAAVGELFAEAQRLAVRADFASRACRP